MPFDPQWPQNGQIVDADRFREQFTSLKDLIDAIQGGGISSVVVDAVNTLPAESPANVGLSLNGSVLHFTFDLPQGSDGPQGNDGPQGQTGNDGQQGPPFAQAVVDSVNTLPAGSAASVSVSFDGSNVHFTFNIPQGSDGATGPTGPPGEITQSQLDSAISGTSANTNNVSTLDTAFADPDMESLRQKLNEMILNGRR